jgi:hypothetical protein
MISGSLRSPDIYISRAFGPRYRKTGVRTTAVLILLLASACRAEVPEVKCSDKCDAKVASRCSHDECARGCAFILDRIVEREDDNVLACMAGGKACDDPAWADCASKIGVHATGAPPTNVQTVKPRKPDEDE